MLLRTEHVCLLGLIAWFSPIASARLQWVALHEQRLDQISFRNLPAIDTEQSSDHETWQNETSTELSCLVATPSYGTLSSIDGYWRISQLSKRQPHKRLLPLSKGKQPDAHHRTEVSFNDIYEALLEPCTRWMSMHSKYYLGVQRILEASNEADQSGGQV